MRPRGLRYFQGSAWTCILLSACAQQPLDELRNERASALSRAAEVTPWPASNEPLVVAWEDLRGRFPLSEGLRWTYQRFDPTGSGRVEVAEMRRISWEGSVGYQVTWSTPGADASESEVWAVQREQVMRVRETELSDGEVSELTTYEPGFLRFDFSWSDSDTETAIEHVRAIRDALGGQRVQTRQHRYSVLNARVSVDVPAGRFSDCLWVERSGDGDTTQFWFAPGIGLVRQLEVDTEQSDELVEFESP